MVCNRFESDGMRFLDGEMTVEERASYQEHVKGCDHCSAELKDLGRIVRFSEELELKPPDQEFWKSYWTSWYRRTERGTGFLLLIVGTIAVLLVGIYKAVTSPEFLTFKGLGITAVLLGLVIVFLSVVRERYHESKSDPYKEVEQ